MLEPSPKTQSRLVILIVLLHLAIAIPLAYILNIWVDEASTLYATQNGFWTAFQTAAVEQKQAPLYFWILSLWRYIDGSIFFARLFSMVCSVAAIYVFFRLAKRLFKPKAALIITAFLGLHPFLIWASIEMRVYSMVVLLSILLIRLFYDAFWADENASDPKGRIVAKAGFLFVVVVSLYTNYYLGFVIAGLGVSLFVSRKWLGVRTFAVMMLIAGIAFIPMLLVMRAEFAAKTGGFVEERSIVEGLRIIWNHVLSFILPTEVFPGSEQSSASVVRVWLVRALFAFVCIAAVMRRKSITSNTVLLASVAFTAIAFFFAAYYLVGSSYVVIRHASILFAPVVLSVCLLIADITKNWESTRSKTVGFGVALVVLASFCYGTINLFPNLTKRGDWERVGSFIKQNESPDQPIIVFITFEALALRYNYSGVNRILPDERFFEYGPEGKAGSPESLKREIDFVISEIPSESQQIWLALDEKCIATEACIPLQNYIWANYTIEIEKDFFLEKLYLLKKKPQ